MTCAQHTSPALNAVNIARYSSFARASPLLPTSYLEPPGRKHLPESCQYTGGHTLTVHCLTAPTSAHLKYMVSRWCETDEPPGRRWMLASVKVGRTIRLPSALMITRCPGRLYMAQNLPPRVTTSCRSKCSYTGLSIDKSPYASIVCKSRNPAAAYQH